MLSSTYMPDLDLILKGGLTRPSSILIAGPTGSGRTMICLQSLFAAAKAGEKCIYITVLSEPTAKLLHLAQNYSFFDEEALKCGNLRFLELDKDILTKGDYATLKYFHTLLQDNPERIVIDPVTVLFDISPSFENDRELLPLEKRAFLVNLLRGFATANTLLMMIGDLAGDQINTDILSRLSDVVIELGEQNQKNDETHRYIKIVKSRGRDSIAGKHGLKLSNNGSSIMSRNLL